jgi:hypothetical protein
MRKLWRLHIRPYGGNGDVVVSVALCLDRQIIGMGWAVPGDAVKRSTDLEWYKVAADREYGNTKWHSVWTFAEAVQIHDLVWFRNLEGRFYLAEVLGPWEYAYDDEAAIGADVINTRAVRIIEAALADAVPGKIIACFRPAKTFQPIKSPGMLAFSEKLAGMPLTRDTEFDLFEFMSDADLENLIFVYLQCCLGWYVLPGTRTATTAHYEFVLVHRQGGERALVQVKSGHTGIDASRYAGEEKAFLFATSDDYGAELPANAVVITRDKLVDFMRSQPQLLPRAVSTWISITGLPAAALEAAAY